MKRLMDILVSATGLCILSPLFLFITLLIVIFDGGNPFFVQERVGKKRKLFSLYKFKTMKPPAAHKKNDFGAGDTSRITSLGRFLRKTKLDELPQLFNVLKGDMSLVGPRPEVKKWTNVYPEMWKTVLTVRPGLTDNASIRFRNEEELLARSSSPDETYREEILPKKLALYIDYVNNRSFSGDIKILLKTIKVVLFG